MESITASEASSTTHSDALDGLVPKEWMDAGFVSRCLFNDSSLSEGAATVMLTFPTAFRKIVLSIPSPPIRKSQWSLCCIPKTYIIDVFQLDHLFMSNAEYDPDIYLHFHMMSNVWKRLTGDPFMPEVIGPHWESIGFDTSDPRTALNVNCGLINVLFLLHLTQEWTVTAQDVYNLSILHEAKFPLARVSIDLGSLAIQCFKRGFIRSYEKEKSITWGLCRFHVALIKEFAHQWSSKCLTMANYETLLQDLRCRSDSYKKVQQLAKVHVECHH